MRRNVLAVVAAASLLLLVAGICDAQIPQKMNYQVMLTDDSDQPLVNESVQLVFRLYNVPAGGGSLWNETHNVVTNSIGVVSVVLGTYTPLSLAFDGPLWLQVAVDGEIMSPRRELTSAPYTLGGGGSGDGHSLDASDGSPTDVVRVSADGLVTVGDLVYTNSTNKLAVFGERRQNAGRFVADSDYIFGVGMFAKSDSSGGVVGNAGTTGDWYAGYPTAVTGIAGGTADGALFSAQGNGKGVSALSGGPGDAFYAYAGGSGRSGYFEGGNGVEMVLTDADSEAPVLKITNYENSGVGDCLWMYSQPGTNSGTQNLYSSCYSGKAGHFSKSSADGQYAVSIWAPSSSSPGLYVWGYIYATSSMAHGVETSRGTEAVFGLSSPEIEIVSSGQGRLSGGTARVDFDRTFAESIADASDLRITATPVGGWSALYIDSIDANGFDLRSDSGRTDVEFHWMAIGREEGHERAEEIVIPDHDELVRMQQLKEEDMRSRRKKADPPEQPSVISASSQ